ncbi:MAG: transcriptional regulator NrdR [Lentisphaeria bacterium]|nr:transcriptional regulator NrdR [Lentisphaeria bacterium]
MRCPACGCEDDKVVDSRAVKDGAGVRRRRECTRCLHRFTTYEGIIQEELKVVKKNNIREDFDKDKLRRGIENACYKRPIGQDAIDRLVEEVANCIQKDFDKEVSSTEVGNRVMNALRQLDQVAYVRFASVYRKFKDVDEFIEEIKTLEKR